MLGLAAIAAVGIVVPASAPANAETVKKVIIKKGDRGHHYGWRHRHRDGAKVVIKSGDRGHHYGWRNRDRSTVVIKRRENDNVGFSRRHRDHDGSRVVIKKKIVND
jgi:hypothetical protein